MLFHERDSAPTRTRPSRRSCPDGYDRQYDTGGNLRLVGSENFAQTYWALVSTHQGYLPATESYAGSNASDSSLFNHEYEHLTGRVRRISSANIGGTFQDVTHTYDDNGNLETRTDHTAPSSAEGFEQFVYDESDRLTDHFRGIALLEHIAYTPDSRGNIASRTNQGTYRYDPIPNRPANMPSSVGNIAIGFDPRGNGNVTSRGVSPNFTNFTYDSAGQPTRVSIGTDLDAVRLKYHTNGERSAKLFSDGRSIRYSGAYEREVTQTGSTEHRYRIYTPFGPMGEIVRSESGTELSRTYWHKDLLGSPEVITRPGAVIHRQKFSAFGQSSSPTWESTNAAVRRVRRGYTGHEHDPETGLVNMGARLYDNVLGRFMAPDPIVQVPSWTQSWNRFSYAWNSPHNWVDPTGLENSGTGDGGPTINGEPAPELGFTIQIPLSEIPGLTDPGPSPLESPAPLTAPRVASGDVRTPAEAPGASTGDEFLPAEWEDPPVANQGFAPKIPNAILSNPNFKTDDSAEMWKEALLPAREALRDALVRIDRARSERDDTHRSVDLWRGLVAGRWSLVEHFERDGRRYYLAHKNDPELAPDRALTARERQVLGYVELGSSNKLIAYALGLSSSSVSTLLSSARRKLGIPNPIGEPNMKPAGR